MSACQASLPDGRRHFQHGPIDILIGADGDARAIEQAHVSAWRRFRGVLEELVGELPVLREPLAHGCRLRGPIARSMWHACHPYRTGFITPMAAVAGAVAQDLITHYRRAGIARAWVNNGGDIAWHLAPGHSLRMGLFADLGSLDPDAYLRGVSLDGCLTVTESMTSRGVATSGWRGRSFSCGIADSVTVLARTAAQADAAATVIANAVDVDDARIGRVSANTLRDDTDLGDKLVTVDVPALSEAAVMQALAAGRRKAFALRTAGLIDACTLVCQGRFAVVPGADQNTKRNEENTCQPASARSSSRSMKRIASSTVL